MFWRAESSIPHCCLGYLVHLLDNKGWNKEILSAQFHKSENWKAHVLNALSHKVRGLVGSDASGAVLLEGMSGGCFVHSLLKEGLSSKLEQVDCLWRWDHRNGGIYYYSCLTVKVFLCISSGFLMLCLLPFSFSCASLWVSMSDSR